MRERMVKLAGGDALVVYSAPGRIVLQVRRLVHGSADPLAASFKSAVALTPGECLRVAGELLMVAAAEVSD